MTRDRREFRAEWIGREFVLIDTGGWQATGDELHAHITAQAEAAMAAADAVIFVVDATTELSDDDLGVARMLKNADQPVIVAANKVDNAALEAEAAVLWGTGLGEPHPVSALHGRGVGDLLDELVAVLPDSEPEAPEDDRPRLAIVGRPNVGKSTLLNRLLGEERVLVSDKPGTTRDPIDVGVEIDGQDYLLIDTAGIRRAPKIGESADYFAVVRAKEVLQSADVALLLVDGLDGATQQDQRIAEEAETAGVGLIVLLNKWDAAEPDQREWTEGSVTDRLGFVDWAPVLRISAKTGARVHRLGRAIEGVLERRTHRVPTGQLNRLVRDWSAAHPPPVRKGRRPKILYAVQAGTAPPTFVLFVSGGEVGPDYLRFIERRLREAFDFTGVPVHVVARRRQRK